MTSCQRQQHAWVDTPEGTCLEQERYPPPFQTLTRTTCPVGGPSNPRDSTACTYCGPVRRIYEFEDGMNPGTTGRRMGYWYSP